MSCTPLSFSLLHMITKGFTEFKDDYLSLWKDICYSTTLIKKKIKFSSYMRKFRVEQLQSHIRGRAS